MKKIREKYTITSKKSKSKDSKKSFITEPFSMILTKMKAGKKAKLIIKTDDTYEQTEKQEQNDPKSHQMQLENQKQLIKLYHSNYTTVFEDLKKNFLNDVGMLKTELNSNQKNEKINFSQPKPKKPKYGFEQFNKTSYVNYSCMKEFYEKYSQYNTLTRKHIIKNNTPSFAFIKSTKDQKIIPNPLGLLKRVGDDKILGINNQKVGDNYITALSNSLKYSDHLTSLEFGGNRLSSLGVSQIFKTLNENKNLAYKLKTIDLSENHIGKNQIKNLVDFLKDPKCNLEELNLFGNLLGDENIILICDTIANYIEYKITSLNLGKNNIKDSCSDVIVNLIKKCSGLRIFIINHNWLHNASATKIMKELINHYELRILDLSWNCIGDDLTATPKYESLVNKELNHPERLFNNYALNETLTTLKLNLRRNPLLPPIDATGGKKPSQDKKKGKQDNAPVKAFSEPKKIQEKPKEPTPFAVILGEYFTKESLSLIHLDISHNNLNFEDCKLISEKSKVNHNILGMHVDGNCMEINCLGFLSPVEKLKNNKYFCESQIYYGIDKNYELRKTGVETVRKIRGKNNCWICEGFREIKFEYIPSEPIDDPTNHLVKLHLNFDDYRPFDMICNGSSFQIVRMCPPGEIHYFFTVDSIPVKTQASTGNNNFEKIPFESEYIKYTFEPDYMEELKNIREKIIYHRRKEQENEDENEENTDIKNNNKKIEVKNIITELPKDKITTVVDTISKLYVKVNHNVISENLTKNIVFSEPRPERIINKFVKPRTPWSFPVSIWAYYGYQYEGDSEEYLNQCFEFDFNRCQFYKDFKDDESLAELKTFLRERYREMIDCYKYYASLSGFQIWQITQNNLTEFISHCPGMCDIKYDINNIFLTQKTVCGNLLDKEDRKKNNKNLSDNIVRHQFMNLLVKSAKDKYVTVLKTTKDVLAATKLAFEKHFDPAIKGFEYHKWRMERYYNEQVDNFLKTFLPILDGVYLSVAKQKGPRKKDVWMVLDEFNNFVQSIVDINEYPIRDNPYVFNQSIPLQVNEIYTDKHIIMFLPEFLEALCRTVDKASPIPPGENKEDWPLEKRQAQPLVKKLENILPVLIKLISHPDLKLLREKFPMPSKDLVTGLYVPNYDSPFYKDYIIKTEPRAQRRGKTRREKTMVKKINESANENKEKKDEEIKTIEEEKINDADNANNATNVDNNEQIKNEENILNLKEENNNEGLETAETHQNENKEKEGKIDDLKL